MTAHIDPGAAIVLAPGHPEHGVVRYARRLAPASRARFVELPGHEQRARWRALLPEAHRGVVHVHYTDQLFGVRCEDGPAGLAALVHGSGPALVTLHDVPVGDGTPRDDRRARAYRQVAALARVVIISSADEHHRLRRIGVTTPIEVLPLAWEPLPVRRPPEPPPGPTVVGILGFVFPGKGHDDVIAAAAAAPSAPEVWVLGRASPGHDDLLASLTATAARAGVPWRVTGFVPDRELARLVARVTVPVVPHTHVSASASMGTWMGAGRRALARDNAYSREVAALVPDAVVLYRGDGTHPLVDAIERAAAGPDATWLAERPRSLSPTCVGARHAAIYDRLVSS